MTSYKIFFAVVCTFVVTLVISYRAYKNDLDLLKIKYEAKIKADSVKYNRQIAELEECLFVKKIAD